MPEIKTYGIVLHYADFSESSRMVTLFTPGFGKISVSAKGCRRPKSLLRAGCEAYVFAEYRLIENRGSYTMAQADLVEPFAALAEDWDMLVCANQMRDVVECMATAGQERPGLFLLYARFLDRLCRAGENPWMVCLAFQMHALKSEGLLPHFDLCSACEEPVVRRYLPEQGKEWWISPDGSAVLCDACRVRDPGALPVRPQVLMFMHNLLRMDPDLVSRLRLSASIRDETEALWRRIMASRLEGGQDSRKIAERLLAHRYH